MSHKIIDVLSSAHLILLLLREIVLDDDAIWAIARGPADAKNSFALLQGTLDQAPGPNPAYTPTPQCAAVMDSMVWRRLVGNALPGGEHEAEPLAWYPRVPHPALVRQDALPFQVPTVTPMSLLDANGPVVVHVLTP
jgi:hypothetical protein